MPLSSFRFAPTLPPDLAGKAGSVYLGITITMDGKVQDVKVLGGDKLFIDPVVAAVKRFVYEPQLVNGEPSVVTTQASFHLGHSINTSTVEQYAQHGKVSLKERLARYREIKISVIDRKSRHTISIPVWFERGNSRLATIGISQYHVPN
jgi:hypothetical protein